MFIKSLDKSCVVLPAHHLLLAIAISFLLSCQYALGADIWTDPPPDQISDKATLVFIMSGKIERGDYEKLIGLVKKNQSVPHVLAIKSPGGDVIDAIKIGKFIRRALVNTSVIGKCYSACVLIYAGGTGRTVGTGFIMDERLFSISGDGPMETEIGIHRPVYDDSYFSGLSPSEASLEYKKLNTMVSSYLRDMDIPTHIIEEMMSTSSNRVSIWDSYEFLEAIGENTPYLYEWLKAKCGTLTTDEYLDLNSIRISSMAEASPDGTYPSKIVEIFVKERMKNMSDGYKDYLWQKQRKQSICKWDSIKSERKQILQSLN